MNTAIRILLASCAVLLFVVGSVHADTITAIRSGAWTDTTVWQGGIFPSPTDDVFINDTCTVTINQDVTIASLTVGQGLSGVFQTSKMIVTNLTINGNLTVNTGAQFVVRTCDTTGGFQFNTPHTLTISGDITNNGTVFDLRSGSATTNPKTLAVINIIFVGSTNSTVTMVPAYSTTNGNFNAITFNKSGNGRVILGSNVYVDGGSSSHPPLNSIVTFTRGIVETGSFAFVALTGTGASVVGGSDSSYVLGAMGRGMANSTGSTKDFPVGDSSGYRPFNLRSTTAGTSTGHHAIVRLISGNANTGSSTLNGSIERVSSVRYYKVNYNQLLGGGATTMSFDRFYPTYGTDDGVRHGNYNLRAAYSTDERTTWTGMGQLSHPNMTSLTTPPTQEKPDSVNPALVLNAGSGVVYISLADTIGGVNPLQRSTVITASRADTNGTISPNNIVMVVLGGSQTFSMTPSANYVVDTVWVDGVAVDSTVSYTFYNVTAQHTIRVSFKPGNTTVTLEVSLAAGWNMISNPVSNAVPDDSVSHLYPAIISRAFEFVPGSGYQPRDTMGNSKGYWGKFGLATTNTITGLPRTRDSISVVAGWNMVGSISNAVDTATIVQIPPGLKASAWFGFSGGYNPTSPIVPGKAYWIKANFAGKFVFANPLLGPAKAVRGGASVVDGLNTLTITDSKGGSQTLYFGLDVKNEIDAVQYEMPPLPPVGAFDVRFSRGGSMVQTYRGQEEHTIAIQSDAYPLTVRWNVKDGSYGMTMGSSVRTVHGEGTVKIVSSEVQRIGLKLIVENALPMEFALSQNYPNPFNPTTQIKYALPVDSRVAVEVYNVIGQRVRTMLNDNQSAGYHVAEWNGLNDDGGQLSSGLYLLRLSAIGANGNRFSEGRKLLLLK